MSQDYSDIIKLPHHISENRSHLSMRDRAAPVVEITCFVPDERKEGGAYTFDSMEYSSDGSAPERCPD